MKYTHEGFGRMARMMFMDTNLYNEVVLLGREAREKLDKIDELNKDLREIYKRIDDLGKEIRDYEYKHDVFTRGLKGSRD